MTDSELIAQRLLQAGFSELQGRLSLLDAALVRSEGGQPEREACHAALDRVMLAKVLIVQAQLAALTAAPPDAPLRLN